MRLMCIPATVCRSQSIMLWVENKFLFVWEYFFFHAIYCGPNWTAYMIQSGITVWSRMNEFDNFSSWLTQLVCELFIKYRYKKKIVHKFDFFLLWIPTFVNGEKPHAIRFVWLKTKKERKMNFQITFSDVSKEWKKKKKP